ncbi:MAG: hypothetical protein ACREL4_10735 [Gemmatimonadales bacterium]
MKTFVLVVGVLIMVLGAGGIVHPSGLISLTGHFRTSGAFYGVAVVRIGIGLAMVRVAPSSRAPKALRIGGYLIVAAGVASALIGLVAVERADALIQWWAGLGLGVVRLTGVVMLGVGAFIAYASVPPRRSA